MVLTCYRCFIRACVRPEGRMQGGNTPFGAGKKPGCALKGRVHPSHAPYKINTERYFCVVWGAWGA